MHPSAPSTSAAEVAAALSAHLEGVSKLFGSFAALRQVSVDLEPGRCYVLLGENGAGKSTLLRILAGLLRPSFGTVSVFGSLEPQSDSARARIGYMSHAPMLYDELTAQENLRYFASLYPGRACLTPAEALRQVGLDPELTRTLSQYSQGMRQRTSCFPSPNCCCLTSRSPIWTSNPRARWSSCSPASARATGLLSSPPISASSPPPSPIGFSPSALAAWLRLSQGPQRQVFVAGVVSRGTQAYEDQRRALP
jgi:ABC-type transport system involved in cytochrome c biogenesis ATPase subunit